MQRHHPLDDRLRAMFAAGSRLRAIFTSLPSPAIVEMCAYAGFDFVVIDNEHGCADLETTEHMLRAARASGIPAVVRCLRQDIARVLDMGASGVQIPMVESVDEARDLLSQIRYPALGRRGSAFGSRAAGYGAFPGAAHNERSLRAIAFFPMIETLAGVAVAGEIAALDGVDAVFIGPNDLSHAMGHGNDWTSPVVQREIEKAMRAIAAQGRCAGTIALTPDDETRYAAWGASYMATVASSLITQALRRAAQPAGEERQVAY